MFCTSLHLVMDASPDVCLGGKEGNGNLYQNLRYSPLEDGMETYMKYATATGRRGKRLFAEAERWIMADDPTWLCSFVSICYILGLEPDYLRMGLKWW